MIPTFVGKTANDVWTQAAKKLLEENQDIIDSRNGRVNEILHAVISIDNPLERWITARSPSISLAFSLAELVWILNGSNDARIINYWNPLLPHYAGFVTKYPGAYGYRLRVNYGFDQLEQAYNALKCNPISRQIVLTIWDPRLDLPIENGKANNMDIPCNICSLLKIRDGKLEWTQIMRSNDIYRGLPYNIVQFTSLQEILAGWLNIGVGTYTHFSDSLHLYNNEKKLMKIKESTNTKFYHNTDSLALSIDDSKQVMKQIFNRMILISEGDIGPKELDAYSRLSCEHQSYNNIMLILAAYDAHKRGFRDLERDLISNCTNDLFKYMWLKWASEKSH